MAYRNDEGVRNRKTVSGAFSFAKRNVIITYQEVFL